MTMPMAEPKIATGHGGFLFVGQARQHSRQLFVHGADQRNSTHISEIF
jgi:hypothetical protein